MKIKVNGNLLYFDVENPEILIEEQEIHKLPTLIILHGGPGYDHTPYKGFFSSLKDAVQIIYIDQHGNGRSDSGSPESWNFTRWASDINEFCKLLHIEKPIILGNSFGGMVALEYAINYPDNLSKLILCNTLAKFDINSTADQFFILGGEKAKSAFLNFLANASDENKREYAKYCGQYYNVQPIDEKAIFYDRLKINMEILEYFYKNIIKTYDCISKIKLIKVPTLILTGEKDPIATVEMGKIMGLELGDNCYKHIIVSDASHNLIWEKTREVNDYIKDFINAKVS